MILRRVAYALLLIPALALAGPMNIITGSRYFTSSGGGSTGEWADTYISNIADIGTALTDGTAVGIEVGSSLTNLGSEVTSGNGGSIAVVSGGAFDGAENAVKVIPPTACVPAPCNGDNNAQYVAWLRNLNLWNSANHNIAQMNVRVLVYYGPRYFDLAPNAKSWGFQAQTVLSMSGGDGNNRSGVFDNRDAVSWTNWKYPYPTVTTLSIYCNPVQGLYIDECPDSNKLIEIRGSANHAASPPQTGGEWLCYEHVFDTRTNRGNPDGLVKLYVYSRDGTVARTVSSGLSHDAGWDYTAQYIYAFEGLGYYFNAAGTANADNYVMFSHVTFAANLAYNETIGCENIPGFFQ